MATPGQEHDSWSRLEVIFQTAADLPPELRPDYLSTACGSDAELRREVESLLQSAEATAGFLAAPIQRAAQELAAEPTQQGRRLGPYRILRALGEGGMGTVFLAARADEQYQGQVAIKLMHAGLGYSASMQARFRAERQILANLDHPNIARLLDGGVTAPEGAPYLVMEYVDGLAIDEYCRRQGLSIEQRLRLFLVVCSAVEYAHNNLVVHRDIKPANILVAPSGVPKLLDFGIAKLLDPDFADDAAAQTEFGERLMTPEYASPEQIRGESVTTTTDVYGLGVLLYELLTERRPFQIGSKNPLEAARIICEQEPAPPSAALTGLPDARKVKGDLDKIVLMAVRKEPARRYASVGQLAADVRAYLEGYPLVAQTDRWDYRSRKFVGRHKFGVAAAAFMILALAGFTIGMGVLARRARAQQEIAQRQAQFLAEMFQASTPEEARGKTITARDLLDRGAARVDSEFAAEPAVRASLLENIATAYQKLGVLDQAEKLAQRSYDLRIRIAGPDNPATEGVLELLATVIRLQGHYEQAEPLFRRSVAIRRRALGLDDVEVAGALSDLGECLYLEDKDAEAESTLRQALAIYRRQPLDSGATARNYLALLLERKGAYPEAAALLTEAVEITRRIDGPDSPQYADFLHNLGSAWIDSGDLHAAEARLREALAIRRKILGNDHPDLYYSLNNLAYVLLNEGEWTAAEPFARESLALTRRTLGEGNPLTAGSWNGFARVLEAKGDSAEAERDFRRALEILGAAHQASGSYAAQVKLNLGMLELDRGRYADAERLSRQSLDRFRALGGADTPSFASALIELAEDRIFQGDARGAEPLLREALKIRQEKYRPGHSAILFAETRLGEDLIAEGESRRAEVILRRALANAEKPEFPLPAWQVAEPENALAACLLAQGRGSEARKLAEASSAALRNDPRPVFRRPASERLAALEHASRRP